METNNLEPHIQEKNHPEVAGIGYRFLAYILDYVIVGIPFAFIGVFISAFFFALNPEAALVGDPYFEAYITDPEKAWRDLIIIYIILLLIGLFMTWLYHAIMESSKLQTTLGKMAVGIKLTNATGDKITFGRATGRIFAKSLLSPIFCIGFIISFFTKKKQALHDLMAKTIVVKK
ncbi:RDD family protein [Bacillus sp. 179-C3.3 HS]|uniref:RDD family protein n=1 Tax=Bacillus sp. 179-C3.3 HS TaxID=3232162 RepID=UPI00399F0435